MSENHGAMILRQKLFEKVVAEKGDDVPGTSDGLVIRPAVGVVDKKGGVPKIQVARKSDEGVLRVVNGEDCLATHLF